MTVEAVGYGAGTRDPAGRANVLRLWLGEGTPQRGTRPMLVIETNIDDMTPEMLAYVQEKLLAEGAADAWLQPIAMKKGRPATLLSVICHEARRGAAGPMMLRETSTLGVRVRPVERWEAEREVVEFESSLGPAAVKVKRLPGERPQVAPEYEHCRRIAQDTGLPIAEVYRVVQAEGEARSPTIALRDRAAQVVASELVQLVGRSIHQRSKIPGAQTQVRRLTWPRSGCYTPAAYGRYDVPRSNHDIL